MNEWNNIAVQRPVLAILTVILKFLVRYSKAGAVNQIIHEPRDESVQMVVQGKPISRWSGDTE